MTEYSPNGNRPRGAVKINDILIPGWIDFEITNNSYHCADTFYCRLSGANLPKERDAIWFSKQRLMTVELFIGNPHDPDLYTPADLKSWIYGQVDEIEIDPISYTISLSGRDLTGVFIDSVVPNTWVNQTASEIVTDIAKRHGFDTSGIEKTTMQIGKFQELEMRHAIDGVSDWDIMNTLADVEGFKVWVRGKTVFFQPERDLSNTKPYKLQWQTKTDSDGVARANFEHIKFKREVRIARGVQTSIYSWNKRYNTSFEAVFPAVVDLGLSAALPVRAGPQLYRKSVPNLSQDQATRLAKKWYAQLIDHEMVIDVTMPGNNDIDITSIIQLGGTGTDFDQMYFPDSISRSMSFDGGYSLSMHAKWHSPELDAEGTVLVDTKAKAGAIIVPK